MVLAHSPGKADALGASLKKKTAPAAPADVVDGKENKIFPASEKWRDDAKKPWKSAALNSKKALDLGAKPIDFKANSKGAMMVFSPTPMDKLSVDVAPRARSGHAFQISPGNGKPKAPPVLSSGASMKTPAKLSSSTMYETCPTPSSVLRSKSPLQDQGKVAEATTAGATPKSDGKKPRAPLAGNPPWAVKKDPSPAQSPEENLLSSSSTTTPVKQATPSAGGDDGEKSSDPVPAGLVSPLSPAVHNVWLSAVGLWQNASESSGDNVNEASLSLDEDDDLCSSFAGAHRDHDQDSSLLSPGTMQVASDEDLERHCTPGKLKRYIALHLQKLIEHEEARGQLTEELTDARAETMAFKEAFEFKEKEASENALGLEIYQDQVDALQSLADAASEELQAARGEIVAQQQGAVRMKQELQDLHEQQWELTMRAEKAEEGDSASSGGGGGELSAEAAAAAEATHAENLQAAVTEAKEGARREAELSMAEAKEDARREAELSVAEAKEEARREAELSVAAAKAQAVDECATLKALVANLKADLEASKALGTKQSTSSAALQSTVEENAALQKELEELNQDLLRNNEEVKVEVEKAAEANAQLELELQEEAGKKAAVAEELRVAAGAAQKAMSDVMDLNEYQKQMNHTANARIEAVQIELTSSQEEAAELRSKVEAFEQSATAALASSTETMETSRLELAALKEGIAEAQRKHEASADAHKADVERLLSEVDTLKRQGQQTGEEATEEVASLQEQLTSLKRASEQAAEVAKSEIDEATVEVDALQTELASAEVKAEEELALAGAKMEELQAQMEGVVADTEAVVAASKADGETLVAELASTKEELKSLLESHEHATAEAADVIATLKETHQVALALQVETASAAYEALAVSKAEEIDAIVSATEGSSLAAAKGLAEAHAAALREQQQINNSETQRLAAEFEAKEAAVKFASEAQLEATRTKLTAAAEEAALEAAAAFESQAAELGAEMEVARAECAEEVEAAKGECKALEDGLAEAGARHEEAEEAAAAKVAELEGALATSQRSASDGAGEASAQIAHLQSELETAQASAQSSAEGSAEQVGRLEAELSAQKEVAREADVKASTELADLETDFAAAVAAAEAASSEAAETIEKLEAELASEQGAALDSAAQAADRLSCMEEELRNTHTSVEEKEAAVARLEADFEALEASASEATQELEAQAEDLRSDLAEAEGVAEENASQARQQLQAVVAELEVTKAAATEAAGKSEAWVTALSNDLERANEKVSLGEEASVAAAGGHADELESAAVAHASAVEGLEAVLEKSQTEVAALTGEGESLREQVANLEEESEGRAESLARYAEQVTEIVAAGEERVKDFERTIEGLNMGMVCAGEAAAAAIAEREALLEDTKAQLFAAEEGRLNALGRIEMAEMKAEASDAEAGAQAQASQQANMAKDVSQQKLEAALATIDKLAAARAAAETSEADAHTAAAQWKEEVDALQMLRRKMHNELVDLKGNIRVFCRIRPSKRELRGESAKEGRDGGSLVVNPHPTNATGEVIDVFDSAAVGTDSGLRRYGDGKRHTFAFDKVFDGSSTQDQVYSEVQPLVQSALDGYSLCIFAYGQTGSGKTHTMIGDTEVGGDLALVTTAEAQAAAEAAAAQTGLDRGIVYRACEQLFDDLNAPTSHGVWESSVTIEAVEIYNEKLRDLLPSKPPPKSSSGGSGGGGSAVAPGAGLEIRKEPKTGRVYIEGIEAHPVTSCREAVGFLDRALRQRATKATKCNDQSSRSHCVLIVRFAKSNAETGEVKGGALHFCDLAGSERLAKSGSGEDPALLREAQAINKSLSALGNTMSALVVGGRHVPFRDSKLTFLLQECFTGDGKSLLVCALSPETDSVTESVGSLRFAQTVSQVTAATRQRCSNCGEKSNCGSKGEGPSKKSGSEEPNSGGSEKRPMKRSMSSR